MKEGTNLQENISSNGKKISRKIRWLVFGIILSLIFVMNMDQGIVSGTTTALQKEFKINEEQLGMLGSILFIGSTIGCLITFTLINKFNRKLLIVITVSLNSLAIWSLTLTRIYVILLISRLISGLALSYIGIYSSVWCDQFGINKRRALMIALLHVTSPFGYIIGYVFGICFDWKASFYIQAILLAANVPVVILCSDNMYYSMTLISQKCKNEGKEEIIEDESTSKSDVESNDIPFNNEENNALQGSAEPLAQITKDEEDDISVFEEIINKEEGNNWKAECLSTWIELKVCLKSGVFLFTNLALISIYLIVSGVQFWINDYMETALKIDNKELRLLLFASVSATSPIFGIILSGLLTTKLGGYEAKNSILIPLISSISVALLGNFVVLPNNYIVFAIFFWLYLFFGSACLPPMTGIILTSVPKEYAGSASSLSTFLYNVLGKFPAPYLYGVLKSHTDVLGLKFPMIILLNISIIGVIGMIFALKFQYARFKKNQVIETDLTSLLPNGQESQNISLS